MSILEAIVLGITQGLTEFIPVSSSGHLFLVPQIFGWEAPSTAYITFLHFGTLLALLIHYRKLLGEYLRSIFRFLVHRKNQEKSEKSNLKTVFNIIIATIPAAILGIIFERTVAGFYDNPENLDVSNLSTIIATLLLGVVFLFAHKFFKMKKISLEKLSSKGAFIIGASQALAFIHGISRSGITLISAQALGLKKIAAAEFTFLISIPIILATSIYGLYEILKLPQGELSEITGAAIAGFIFSFIFGMIAIKFMLKYLKTSTLVSFGWYRIVFAIVALLILF